MGVGWLIATIHPRLLLIAVSLETLRSLAMVGVEFAIIIQTQIISSCIFMDNVVMYANGAGMSNNSSSPIVTNCIFTGNKANDIGNGGAISNSSSSPIIINCSFLGNSSQNARNVQGGGIWNSGGSPTITNCLFEGNYAISTDRGK